MLPAVFGQELWAYFKSIYHDVGGVFMYRAVVSLWFTPLESEYRTLSTDSNGATNLVKLTFTFNYTNRRT